MRTFIKSTIAALALATFATAGPVHAQSSADGFWSVGTAGGGFSMKVQTTVDPTTQVSTSRGFVQLYLPDSTWRVCTGALASGKFTCDLTAVHGGQTLTGPYRQPVTGAGGTLEIDFFHAQASTSGANGFGGAIAKVELATGSRLLGAIVNAPFTTVYAQRWMAANADFSPTEPVEAGTGHFIELQGTHFRLVTSTYADDGSPVWVTVNGQCVMNANLICTVTAPVIVGTTGQALSGNAEIQTRNNGSIRVIWPGETGYRFPDIERRIGPYAWN